MKPTYVYKFICTLNDKQTDQVCYILDSQWHGESSHKIISHSFMISTKNLYFGSGAFSGKMLLVRIVENNKIDAYFRVV